MNNNNIVFLVVAICMLAIGGFVYLTPGEISGEKVEMSSGLNQKIKQYILDNPEVLEESLNGLSNKRKESANNKRADYLKENYKSIIENSNFPKAGSLNAKHHIIEFFDYNCGWCKRMMETKDKILKEKSDTQIIFMELPILGDYSVAATRAAFGVYLSQPEKYLDFHRILLAHKGSIKSQEVIDASLSKAGVDMEKFNVHKDAPKIDDLISEVRGLAINLGIMGTPAYILDGKLVPGAFQYEDLEKLLGK